MISVESDNDFEAKSLWNMGLSDNDRKLRSTFWLPNFLNKQLELLQNYTYTLTVALCNNHIL